MGIDLEQYRSRIGAFRNGCGTDVCCLNVILDFGSGLKVIGVVSFIGTLLLIAGIESNPGPDAKDYDSWNVLSIVLIFVTLATVFVVYNNYHQPSTIQTPDAIVAARNTSFEKSNELTASRKDTATSKKEKRTAECSLTEKLQMNQDENTRNGSSSGDPATSKKEMRTGECSLTEKPQMNQDENTRNGSSSGDPASSKKEKRAAECSLIEKPQMNQDENTRNGSSSGDPATSKKEKGIAEWSVTEKTQMNQDEYTRNGSSSGEISTVEEKQGDIGEVDVRVSSRRQGLYKSHEGATFHNLKVLLAKLDLGEKYPQKITMTEFLSIDMREQVDRISYKDLPWILLKNILLSHPDCRDKIVADALKSINSDMSINKRLRKSSNKPMSIHLISPLDVFYVVLQCCDLSVQNMIYKKLFLCKIALPFYTWNEKCKRKEVSVLPLQSIIIDNSGKLQSALEIPTLSISFLRIGRPSFSKSKFLNGLLSEDNFCTFFNKESPLGTKQRTVSLGYIEVFWLISEEDNLTRTIFNLRGDFESMFTELDTAFLQGITDILCVIVELSDISKYKYILECIKTKFRKIILILNNPRGSESQELFLNNLEDNENIEITTTFSDGMEVTHLDQIDIIKDLLSEYTSAFPHSSIASRLSSFHSSYTDDDREDFVTIKKEADAFLRVLVEEDHKNLKEKVTPAHFIYSKAIGELFRDSYRSEIHNVEKVRTQITENQVKQIESVKPIVKIFAKKLTEMRLLSANNLKIFIFLVSAGLDSKMRIVLPELRKGNREDFANLWQLKKENACSNSIEQQERKVKESSDYIDKVLFSIQHLFREISHVCDACLQLNRDSETFGFPSVDEIADIFAYLIIQGYPFELLNGEDNYMIYGWIKKVINMVHFKIQKEKVLSLSVLGIQSSGKSTLLNTMFGSQFSVSAGRCTRGVHMQLLSLEGGYKMPFRYLLLIDTEGIRSPEKQNEQFNYDNELATFVTGLADITLLNVMGENMSEIAEVLQIVVHAFLRLKLANDKLKMKKSCILVHHNVAEASASDNMNVGLQKVLSTLDSMTREAAASEGISDIESFNDVIDFDVSSDVFFFPNLWQGNPPFARVNAKYSTCVKALRNRLFQKALSTDKHYKSLNETVIHMNDLWQGVIKENFVFSFRNSFEIKAYCWLDKMFQDVFWNAESSVFKEIQIKAKLSFSRCTSVNRLEAVRRKVIKEFEDIIESKRLSTEESASEFFENREFKDTVSAWKPHRKLKLKAFWEQLENKITVDIFRMCKKREIEISTASMCKEHEQKLYNMSHSLASEIRKRELDEKQINIEFERIWIEFENDMPTQRPSKETIEESFEKCLKEMLQKDYHILGDFMRRKDWKQQPDLRSLKGTFDLANITEDDISMTKNFQGVLNKLISGRISDSKLQAESLFSTLETSVNEMCSTDVEIDEHHVKQFLREIDEWIKNMDAKKSKLGFSLTSTFRVKIYLHTSRFALKMFVKHNDKYEREYGISAHLASYKKEARIIFDAMIEQRSKEDTAAILLVSKVESYAIDEIKSRMTQIIIDELLQHIPRPKYHLMIEIVSDLAQTRTFASWLEYIRNAKYYAREWITEKSEGLLFKITKVSILRGL